MGEPRYLLASDVHPNLLDGLIPVDKPCFIDENGQAKTAKAICIGPWKDVNFDVPTNKNNLPLISHCVKRAKESGWRYLYCICCYEHDLYIRGSESD
jgi:hypothetical protein